jgi:D-alanyl-D-alanine carboxypeptidase/D-alanyl-D-alanine-endopeptidase (penicillin-binding protein 4)
VTPQVVDGSGLSRANLTSPRQVVRLLQRIGEEDAFPAFERSLAVAGVSGTLRRRLRGTPAQRRCRGKTGTLTGVSALAGYCTTTSGSRVAFAFLMNRVSALGARRLQDRMTVALARYTPAGG